MNYIIHWIVIEIFMAIYEFRYGRIIFNISTDMKKYLAMIVFSKSIIYNVGTLYLRYIGVIKATYQYGAINIFCCIVIFALYKLLTGAEYLKIVFGTIMGDFLCVITICVPYFIIYAIANHDFGFDQNFDEEPGIYVIFSMFVILAVGYIIERYVVNKFLQNFTTWKIPFKNLFRVQCIIWLIWIFYTYSVQENATITWFYALMQLLIAVVLLYISSWFYRYRENKKIQIENQQLNYENQVMKEYCETLEQQVETMEQFQDDIVRHMKEVEELAKDNDDIKEYVEELKESYKGIK